MKLTFLGTGTSQGVPVIGCECEVCTSNDLRDRRLRTSVMIEVDRQTIVVDSGPDFRQQMLRENPDRIDAVLFTHEHKDHIAGLDDIRPFNFKSGKPIDVYATQQVEEALKREYRYIFDDLKYPGAPEVRMQLIRPDCDFRVGKTKIIPIEVLHYRLPVLGFRIKNVAYITDANFISEKEKEKLQGLDVLVLNALRKQKHISHFNLSEAVDLSRELKPKRTYLTHISHLMGCHSKVADELPEGVFLAYDGLKIDSMK